VDESSPYSRSLQAKHRPNVINKHYDNVPSYKQRKREYASEEEGNVSTYPNIEEFTRQMDNFAAQGLKYTTPYTNSRSKGVVPRVILRDSTAAPSMSWLTSTSVANIRRGVQGYGTPVQPSLLNPNTQINPSQSTSRPSDTRVYWDSNDDSNNHSFEDPILDESPLTRNIRGPIQLSHSAVGESGVRTINILSQNVKIRPVDNVSFQTLMDLKEDVVKAIQKQAV